jgi:hypothetical protein
VLAAGGVAVLVLADLGLAHRAAHTLSDKLALWVSVGMSLGVLLSSYPLVRWLGLASLYIARNATYTCQPEANLHE